MSERMLRTTIATTVAFALLAWSSAAGAFTYTNPNCSEGASWPNLPVRYQINDDGSDDMSFSATQKAVEASFDVWGDPCCSQFSGSNTGTTTQSALDVRGTTADPVLSWIEEESNWPQFLGDTSQVIGVTMSSFSGCDIVNAPIVFNGVGFTYRPAGNVDLQAIATHEVGHLTGLGHTSAQGATMAPSYLGGTKQRTLEQDDVDGVCSMYGGGTCGCESDSDCNTGEQCNGSGECEEIPCSSDADCANGKECNTSTGECETPTCSSDADCTRDGYECDTSSGRCVLGCRVCKQCNSDADCGSPSDLWGCVESSDDRNFCLRLCPENGCPGDSTCQDVEVTTQDGGTRTLPICLNPGACTDKDSTICPSSYVCGEGQVVNNCSTDSGTDTDAGPTGETSDTGTTGSQNDAGSSSYSDAENSPEQEGSSSTAGDEQECTTPDCRSDAGSESDAGGVVVPLQQENDETEATCHAASGKRPAPFTLMIVALAGFAVYRRSRRR